MKVKLFSSALAFAALVIFNSCATSISVPVEHPPIMDMRGIERITVVNMDSDTRNSEISVLSLIVDAVFRTSVSKRSRGERAERNAAWYLTQTLSDTIASTGSFKLIDPYILHDVPKDEYSQYVDAYLNAGVSSFSSNDKNITEIYKSKDGEKKEAHYIDRTVSIDFWYRFVRAKDGVIIGTVRKTGSTTERFRKGDTPISVNTITKNIIHSQLSGMRRELVPWTSIEVFRLAKDKTKDARVKEAVKLVSAGRSKEALASFHAIYEESGNYAAGFNEALITAALGSLNEAQMLFRNLGERMGYNTNINYEIFRIEKRLADIEALKDYN
jgi:hypothetical protein